MGGKVAGVLHAATGLFIGIIVSLAATIVGLAGRTGFGALTGGLVGIGAMIALPILYGVLGFIVASIAAWLHNLAGGCVGGIEIDLQEAAARRNGLIVVSWPLTRCRRPAARPRSIFTATERCSRVSVARNTSPMPPAPSGPSRRYGPRWTRALATVSGSGAWLIWGA